VSWTRLKIAALLEELVGYLSVREGTLSWKAFWRWCNAYFKTVILDFVHHSSLLKPLGFGIWFYFNGPWFESRSNQGTQQHRFSFVFCSPEDGNRTNFRNEVVSINNGRWTRCKITILNRMYDFITHQWTADRSDLWLYLCQLQDAGKKTVLVFMWYSTCPPCRRILYLILYFSILLHITSLLFWCHTVLLRNNLLLNLVPLFIHHYMFRPLYKAIFRWVFLKLVLVTLIR
jgi:hypothetical protein